MGTNRVWWRVLALVLGAPAFPGGLRAEDAAPAAATPDPAAAEPADPGYVYKGDRLRDPFIPLVGAGFTPASAAQKTDAGPFNPAGAELKGILKTSTGRWALIRTSEGATYFIQNGRVYDPQRKRIEGYQGIVKEKSVIILAPGNQEFELKAKKDEKEAPKP